MRTRRIRRTVIIVAVLTILVLFATGAVGSSIARAKDLVDTAVIALAPAVRLAAADRHHRPGHGGSSFPVAFVEMGGDSCAGLQS